MLLRNHTKSTAPLHPRLLVRDYIRETFEEEESVQMDANREARGREVPAAANPTAASVEKAAKPSVRTR